MLLNESGKTRVSKLLHSEKENSPMCLMEFAIFSVRKFLHPLNELLPIVSTDDGMFTVVMAVSLQNVYGSIVVSEFGIFTFVTRVPFMCNVFARLTGLSLMERNLMPHH